MSKIKSKIKEPLFDRLRVIATVSVLFIHLSGWFLISGARPKSLYLVLANISRFAVPMFVFLAAALFYFKYSDRVIAKKRYYLGRFQKIFIPYFVVSVIYYLYRLSPLVTTRQRIAFVGWGNLLDFGRLFLTIGVFSHLYFVPLIIMFYLVAPYLIELYKKKSVLWGLLLVTANILFVTLMSGLNIERLYWRWTIFPYLVYVLFGFIFANNYEKIKKLDKKLLLFWVTALFVAIVAIYQPYNAGILNFGGFQSYLYDSLFGAFWILALVLISLPDKFNNLFSFLSEKSFGIYLFHYLLIDLIFGLMARGFIDPFLNISSYFIMLLVVSTISIILYYPIEHLLNYKRK